MNSKQRLDAFYAGQNVDRLPNLTIVGSVVTRYNGIDLERYCKDPIAMAEGAILAAKDLSLDYIQIASDLSREAEGYGTVLQYTAAGLPTVIQPGLTDITDVDKLKPLRVSDIPRVRDIVDATAYALKAESEIYPMSAIVGPATVAGNLRGVEDLMVDLFDEPECVHTLLNIVTETLLDSVRELAKVGARYIYVPDPVASLLSPNAYREFILPLHRALFEEMKVHGIGGRLHMCGNTLAVLPESMQCGAYIIDIDHATDFPAALATVGDRCILNGNIDPVADVFDCDAAHTKAAIEHCAALAAGHRALFMPGCELPTATPLENIRAIHEALCSIAAR